MGLRKEHHRHSRKVTSTKRWKALRAEILERDKYRCRDCGCGGRLEVDHIKPVRTHPELSYTQSNLQALCPGCHTRKTRIECGHAPKKPEAKAWDVAVAELESRQATDKRFGTPYGLLPSRVPVVIVCGPPGAGKNTYIRNHARSGDIVIDFDDYLKAEGGQKWDKDPAKVKAAFRARDAALRDLHNARRCTVWLPLTAPSAAERAEWKRLLVRARTVMLAVNADTCKARIRADPERQHAIEPMCAGVDHWWHIYAADSGAI